MSDSKHKTPLIVEETSKITKWAWDKKNQYYENLDAQNTKVWFELRKYLTVTGSSAHTACGLSQFSTMQEMSDELLDFRKKEFTEEQAANMKRGHDYEPLVRDWFRKTYSRKIREAGLIVPIWDLNIGCSVDGFDDTDPNDPGIIEIKVMKKMAPMLEEQLKTQKYKNHEHIFESHYYQMQFNMHITNRNFCTYLVFCPFTEQMYTEKIQKDTEKWTKVIYPGVKKFIDLHQKRRSSSNPRDFLL